MNTLDRYIQQLFLKNLAYILLALGSLYAVVEFIEKVDDFIEHQADLIYYLLYPLYNTPLIFSNTLPMAVLLSAFATIGNLSVAGFLLSLVLLVCNLWLTPLGIQETEYIKNVKITKRPEITTESNNIFFRNGNRIVHINRSFPQRGTLLGVLIVSFNDQFKPVERLQATSANYQGNDLWLMENVKVWEFSPDDKAMTDYRSHDEWLMDLDKDPYEVTQIWNNPEEMTQTELSRLIETLQADGHDPQVYQMESHLRTSKAFIPLIMVLLGTPFALQRGRKASLALGIIISLAIFLAYFILYAVFAALGGSGILSPLVAAWSANILMALTGTWMFLKAQD
ncbi:MAG: LptF/LptG family permease [Desulfuromonadales bacterium]